jgi:hypothetical protein
MATPVFNPATGYYESPRADGGVNKYTSIGGAPPSAEFKRLTNLYEEQKTRTLYAARQPQTLAGQPAFGQKVLTEYQLHPELYPRPQVSAFYKSPEKLQQEFEIDVATKQGLQPEFIRMKVGEIEPRYYEREIDVTKQVQEANKGLAPGLQKDPSLYFKGHVDTPMEQKLQAGSFVNTTYVPDVEKVEGFHPAPAGYIGSKFVDPTGVERKYTLADVAKQGYVIPKQGLEKFDFGIGSRYAPLGYFPKEGYWKPIGNVIMKEGRHEEGVLDYTSPAEGRLRAGKEGTLYQSENGQWMLVDVYGQAVTGGSVGSPLVAGSDYELTNKKLTQQVSPGTLISKGVTWATFPTESSLAKQKAADVKIGFQAAEQRMYKTKYPEATFPAGKEFGVFPEPRSRFPEAPAATPAAKPGSEPEVGLPKSAAAGVLNLSWMGERAAFAPQTGQPTTVNVERFPKVVLPSLGKPRVGEGIEKIPGGRAGVGASQVPYREAAGVGAYPFKRSYEVGGIVGETAYAAGGEAERKTGLYQRTKPAEFPMYQNLTPMSGSGLFMPTEMATPPIPTAARGGMKGYTSPERMGEANLTPAWEGILSGYGALQEGEAQRIARLESIKAAQRATREPLGARVSPAGLPLESTVLEHQCLYSVHHTRAIPQHKPKTKGNIQKKGATPKKPSVTHKTKGTGSVRHPRREEGKVERGYWNYEPTATYILGLSSDQEPKKAKKPKSQR